MPAYKPVKDRIMSFVKVYPDGCWFWTGVKSPGGYGQIRIKGRDYMAHRVSYELFKGPIPDGLVIDHLCGHPPCINPDHLAAVTERANIMRSSGVGAVNARKTHCPQGHEYSPENTIVLKGGKGRRCKICHAAYWLRSPRRARRMAEQEQAREARLAAPKPPKPKHVLSQEQLEARNQAIWEKQKHEGRTICAIHAKATHCPKGHAYDEANTYVSKAGKRYCRTCHRETQFIRNRKLRAAKRAA